MPVTGEQHVISSRVVYVVIAVNQADSAFTISGTLVPNAAGTYSLFGTYNGQDAYKLDGGDWYMWWNGTRWIISGQLGYASFDPSWSQAAPGEDPVGDYSPINLATGTATVSGSGAGDDAWSIMLKGLFHGQRKAWDLLRILKAATPNNKYYITKLLAITGESEDLEALDFA